MEPFEDDEGYTSPSENGMAQFTCTRGVGPSLLSKRSVSWTGLVVQHRQGQKPNLLTSNQLVSSVDDGFLTYVTDDKEHSRDIVDKLWLIAPTIVSGGYHSLANTTTTTTSSGTLNQLIVDSNASIRELKIRTEKPVYRSLAEFICDAMDLLCGKPSFTFQLLQDDDEKFCKNPIILVHGLTPSAISNYCDIFLTMGSLVLKLTHVDRHHNLAGTTGSSSKVYVAFINFIKDFVKVYQTIIMLKRSSFVSLTMLRRFIMPYYQQFVMLCHIIEKQFCGYPLILLKNLNGLMLMHESPCVSDMLKSLFITCASAYSKYVSAWIYHGSLGPPSEFHIIRNRSPFAKDRRYWTHQFTQNEDMPIFLKDVKTSMFETGKAINLLLELQRKDSHLFFALESLESSFQFHLSHDEIISVVNSFDEKLLQFFNHNDYMVKEIEDTVKSTTAKEDFVVVVDPGVVAENFKELESRFKTERVQTFQQIQDKKRAELVQVQQHLEEARNVRLREAIDELYEEKKRKLYLEEKERHETEKGYELLKEHYGEFLETIGFDILKAQSTVGTVNTDVFPLLGDHHHTYIVPPLLQGSGDCIIEDEPSCKVDKSSENGIEDPLPINNSGDDQEPLLIPQESQSDENIPSHSVAYQFFNTNNRIIKSESTSDYGSTKGIPENVPPRMKCKDFKTRDVAPMKLDLKMFDKPLMPSCTSEKSKFYPDECDAYLIQRFLSLSIEIPLRYQNKAVNLYLLHHIIVTKQLLRHVKALNDFVLLQNGQFGHFFITILIDMVQTGKIKNKEDITSQILKMNTLLQEALSMVVDDEDMNFLKNQLSVIVLAEQVTEQATMEKKPEKNKQKKPITSKFDILNLLCLRLTVEWPLNIIFTEEFLRKYDSIFSFQMRLTRAEILLGKVATGIKSKTGDVAQLNELNLYRYLMLHFVRRIRSYVNVTVIHTSWTELVASFKKMDSLKVIYDLLVHHIKTVTSNCLLNPKAKPVMKLLTDQLIVIEAFCSKLDSVAQNINWHNGEKIGHADYKMLVRMYLVFKEIETIFSQVIKKIGFDLL